MNRKETISQLRKNPQISVLIIGAGINGIGTFRDLALQGVDVLMVDRGDYGSGASAASSHMVHGGIRYLENGEFRLVKEAVCERNRLIVNMPHLVKPLPTTFPIFRWFSGILNAPLKFLGLLDRPSERGALVIKIGMTLYDIYTGKQATVPPHRFEMRKSALARFPDLNPKIICTGTYFDAAMPFPERICIDLIDDTLRDSPSAMAVNYMSAVGGSGDAVNLRDELDGGEYTVRPRLVINAGGPWIDLVNARLGNPTRFMGGTKGSHLVLDHPGLRRAIGDHEFFFENKDGRIVLIFPLLDKVLIGTSDIPIDDPDQARCTPEEEDYFFEMIKRVFPAIRVDPSHIVFRFSGVRPLPHSDAQTTGQISRDHSIEVSAPGEALSVPVYSMVGGKWTTYRAFAAEATDRALEFLGKSRKCGTEDLPVGGGKGYPITEDEQEAWFSNEARQAGLLPDRIRVLFERYGTRAIEVARCMKSAPDRDLPLVPGYSSMEIAYLALQEGVVHLDDLVLRRTMIAMLGLLTGEGLEELAQVVGRALGWSAGARERELKRTREILAENHCLDV